MNIIIVGCGKVGRTLTKHLNDEKHNIAVIDTDSHAVSDLANESCGFVKIKAKNAQK